MSENPHGGSNKLANPKTNVIPTTIRALIGFMGEQESFNFLKGRCMPSSLTDDELQNLYKKSKSAVDVLPEPDLNAEVLDIDPAFKDQLAEITKRPVFAEVVRQSNWAFKRVEIDKIVCFQMHVDTDHSNRIATRYNLTEINELIDFCLPRKPVMNTVGSMYDPQQQAYTIFAPGQDFRVLGNMQLQDPATKRMSYGFTVGWGLPFIQVVKLKDRYFLKNGYHRVYMIRKAGITHVPCILIEGSTYADTGALKPGFFAEPLMMSNKPPVFANFLSDEISPTIQVLPMTKIVRIKAEEVALPVATQLPELTEPNIAKIATTKSTAIPSIDSAYEDFKAEKEDWNIYKLSDGTIIKLRQVLLKIKRENTAQEGEPAQTDYSFDFSNLLMAAFPPSNLLGAPSNRQYNMQELSASIIEAPVKYDVVQEPENEYVTKSGGRLLIRMTSPTFARTGKFNNSGEPIYLANNTQMAVQLIQQNGGDGVPKQ